jgi:hypothetical protein
VDLWADDGGAPASLPAGVVPDIVERAARDAARRLGVEAGAPTAALLTSLGSLVPASNRLQMRQNDTGWTVPPITWTAIIGEPGSNKSATIDWAKSWVKYVEREWRCKYASAKREFDNLQARERDKKDVGNAVDVFSDVVAKPVYRQKIVNDATTEALAMLLAENPDGLLCHVDELAGLFGGMDSYRAKGGKDRPFWLQAKEGGSFTVNRRQSERIVVETCGISVLGGIQPAKIKAMAAGLSDDGLLQRFLPVLINRTGNGVDAEPDAEAENCLKQLAVDIADSESKRRFKFAPEANVELLVLEDFKMREINRPGASPVLQQWLDKLPNEFGRFALIMHFIEWYSDIGSLLGEPPELISRDTAGRARRFLVEFAFSQARAFYGQGCSEADEHAKWIA